MLLIVLFFTVEIVRYGINGLTNKPEDLTNNHGLYEGTIIYRNPIVPAPCMMFL